MANHILRYHNNNAPILAMLGLILFFLVIAVLYLIILVSETTPVKDFQGFMPLIVFSGFFIFLIGAILFSLSIFKAFGGLR
jgi:hypothetical protein